MPQREQALELSWRGMPTKGDAAAVLDRLAPARGRYDLEAGPRRVRSVTYVDTADRRLRRAGMVLGHERTNGPGALTLATPDGAYHQPLTDAPTWPARTEQLPDGEVRTTAAKPMWIRAVAPLASARVVTREVVARDADGEIVVRLEWAELTGTKPARTEPVTRVSVNPEPGCGRDARKVAKKLRASGDFEPADDSRSDELLRAMGSGPGVTARPGITAEEPASVAMARALLSFSDAIAANVDGTIDDVDTEFLHDLRVAVRRTRSLLTVGGDALPERLVTRYAPGFKWLGDLTTPTRDLDVYLLGMDDLAGSLVAGEPGDLDPFAEHLRRERARARRSLVRGLHSQRFTRLLDGWRDELTALADAEDTEGPMAGRFAAEKIRKIVKRVTRKARGITADSPSEDIHDLRKRCKELRYLLEVAQPLCDAAAHKAVVKDLKRLQDVLGEFQDGEVQSEALRVFAERMLEAGKPPASTLLAMGELSARFVTMQNQARLDLVEALPRFLGPSAKERVEALVPARAR